MEQRRVDVEGLRIGFASRWDPEPRATWSGIPWQLRRSLARQAEVISLDARLGRATTTLLKAASLRRSRDGLVTTWQYRGATDAMIRRQLLAAARQTHLDAVLQIQDRAVFEQPYFTFQDLSWSVLLDALDHGQELIQFPGMSRQDIERRHRRQREIYAQATGVLAMSRWFADALIASGLPASRVHVVHPGVNAEVTPDERAAPERGPRRPPGEPRRLLFVGRDFERKGGDLVVRAVEQLRGAGEQVVLQVVGPTRWPMAGEPPDGVEFLGPLGSAAVGRLMREADLFVMPSRFEAFGIVFAEALVAGTPVIARRAYGMPEVIDDGVNGALIDDDAHLPGAIVRCLGDPGLFERTWEGRSAAAAYWSWDRAADDILTVMARSLGRVTA